MSKIHMTLAKQSIKKTKLMLFDEEYETVAPPSVYMLINTSCELAYLLLYESLNTKMNIN